MIANQCLTCALADWERTKSGRLHPSGGGRCTWKKAVQLPASWSDEDAIRFANNICRPRSIDRRRPITRCPTYVKASQSPGDNQ